MPYSLDFIKKVINFVENGGTITKAAHTFGIGIASIYRWLSRPELSATKVKSRQKYCSLACYFGPSRSTENL